MARSRASSCCCAMRSSEARSGADREGRCAGDRRCVEPAIRALGSAVQIGYGRDVGTAHGKSVNAQRIRGGELKRKTAAYAENIRYLPAAQNRIYHAVHLVQM